MGENSRYDRYAHRVNAETEAEASARRVVAGLVERGVPPISDRVVTGRVADIFPAAAAELSAGRPVPLQLRRRAVQDTYAGLHGQDVGLAMAAVFDSLSVTLGQVPNQVRRDVLAAARREHTGPDGPNDPRGRTCKGLTSGFGR